MRALLILFLLAAGCPALRANAADGPFTYNGWTSGAFWGGGYVQNVVLSPSDPNRCYAYIDMAGAYRSDDRGKSWRMLHGAFPPGVGFDIRGLSVDPRNADNILLVLSNTRFAKGHLLASNDGGNSFRIVGRADTDNTMTNRAAGFVIDRNPKNPDEILIGCYDGVMKSSDNGATWKPVWAHKLNTSDLRFDRRDPKRVWLCSQLPPKKFAGRFRLKNEGCDFGVFRSEDGGETWKKISDEGLSEMVQSNSNPDELYGISQLSTVMRSTDNGETWTDFSKGLIKKPVEYPDLYCNKDIYTAIGAGPDFLVVASTLRDFYRLDKGSDTWKRIDIKKIDPRDYLAADKIGDHAFRATGSIIIDPADPNHWYATDFYNVSQTFDGGKTWNCTSTGMSQVVMKSAFVPPGTHDFVVTLMDHGWYITKDGGKTYRPYAPGSFGYERMYFQIAPSDPRVIYTSGPRASIVTVSRDGGKTWKFPELRGLPPRLHGNPGAKKYYTRASVAVDPEDSKLIYLGIAPESTEFDPDALGVYVSRDAGDNWTRMSDGLPAPTRHQGKGFFENTNVCGYELAVSKEGTPIAASIVYNLVCRWDKEKRKWETVRSDEKRPWGIADLQTDPSSKRIWLAARTSGLFYSDDDGRTWNRQANFGGTAGRMYFDRERAGRFTVSSDTGLYLTEDGGKTWWFYDFDGRQPGRSSNALAAIAGDVIVLATQESGVFYHHIKRNPDGSLQGFVRKEPEKKGFDITQLNDFFGRGTLRLLPAEATFTADGDSHTAIFGITRGSALRVDVPAAEHYATVASGKLTVEPGRTYRLNLQARGNVKLTGYFHDSQRRDFLNTQLGEAWKDISVTIVPQTDSLSLAFLNWKQKGYFEIRNLTLAEE